MFNEASTYTGIGPKKGLKQRTLSLQSHSAKAPTPPNKFMSMLTWGGFQGSPIFQPNYFNICSKLVNKIKTDGIVFFMF